jgi:glutamate-5-semialdehyde dehydrogenase
MVNSFSQSSDSSSSDLVGAIARQAYETSVVLAECDGLARSKALKTMAKGLVQRQDDILDANTLDLEMSLDMAVPGLLLEWLKLTPERIQLAAQILKQLGEMSDPIQQVMTTPYFVDRGQTYGQLMPLGVISLIYESFPELGAIATGLCTRTGNSLILKGGGEASQSNQVIVETLKEALDEAGLPIDGVQLLPSDQGDVLRHLVVQDRYINLLIPYGRSSLVQQVVRQATAPVLKTAIGNCYLYWSPSASIDLARWMIVDSHQSEPDPVNAIEKVLVNRSHNASSLTMLWNSLREKGFKIKGDAALVEDFPELDLARDNEWRHAYLDNTIAFKVTESLDEAIDWINHYSNGHADCIATESYAESHRFARRLNSATTYINASPRFERSPGVGKPVFLGMSNQKGLRRGPICLETLTTIKQIVQGSGHGG